VSKPDGDFSYNGIPIFMVGFMDFTLFVESRQQNRRVLSRDIINDDLREHYKKSRDNSFGICYEGVIIDIRKLKENTENIN
jgi:hypothetical protein